jgi:hypothetical protein
MIHEPYAAMIFALVHVIPFHKLQRQDRCPTLRANEWLRQQDFGVADGCEEKIAANHCSQQQ